MCFSLSTLNYCRQFLLTGWRNHAVGTSAEIHKHNDFCTWLVRRHDSLGKLEFRPGGGHYSLVNSVRGGGKYSQWDSIIHSNTGIGLLDLQHSQNCKCFMLAKRNMYSYKIHVPLCSSYAPSKNQNTGTLENILNQFCRRYNNIVISQLHVYIAIVLLSRT